MDWEIFSIIGTVAFALSGAVIAMEEEYDILGVYVLGLVTAFGGGVIRNALIELPMSLLWSQGMYFQIALICITIVFIVPRRFITHWRTVWDPLFDAVGLSAFAIQGAILATNKGLPISAVIVAAMLTGIGGGMIRDVLAGRKPLVLRDEIYAVWGMLAGLCIGLGWQQNAIMLILLFVLVVGLRMISLLYKWKLPRRSLREKARV
ncbi:trimeric intracellular cation channel family protein [Paenibacillus sp. N1-5-1-14]|uniref:trimeric intracellular cation channel family protein n=1 Tax=Paenibacillus radicibacter TaxID=2972488 RepID=UPI0021594705|nr:trimeric intracellular cation channel family protein [Paenibacillus radicibacter]MCR8641348.1 trimeric intracellular cation channel family protein [Paenibacillus radicibacter]